MSAGSFVGALAAGFISDKLGRKWSLEIASAVWIVGSVIQLSSQNVAQLIVGRVINGLTGSSPPVLLRVLLKVRANIY